MFRATRDHSCSVRIERDSYLDFDSRATALKIPPARHVHRLSRYVSSFVSRPRHVSFVNCTYRRFAEQRGTWTADVEHRDARELVKNVILRHGNGCFPLLRHSSQARCIGVMKICLAARRSRGGDGGENMSLRITTPRIELTRWNNKERFEDKTLARKKKKRVLDGT